MGRRIAAGAGIVALLALAAGALVWFATDGGTPRPGEDARPRETAVESDVARPHRPDRRQRPASLHGLVRHANGRPAADVEVRVRRGGNETGSVRTDAAGRFEAAELAPGDGYEVRIDRDGVAPIRVPGISLRPGERGDLGVLVLAPGVEATVRVLAPGGQPVAGAHVEAFRLTATGNVLDQPPSVPVVRGTTDADGTIVFDALAPGSWAFTASAAGFARAGRSPVVLAGRRATERVVLRLEPGFPLSGRVVDTGRQPIPGARVVLLPRGRPSDATQAPLTSRTTSGDDGRFRFESVPGVDVVLWAARPGGHLAVANAVRMPLAGEVEVVLGGGARVEGAVVDAAGDPVSDADVTVSVEVLTGFRLALPSRSDEAGRFAVVAPMDGELRSIEARKAGYAPARSDALDRAGVALRGGVVYRDELTLEPAITLRGHLLGPDGPLEDAEIFVFEGDAALVFGEVAHGRYAATLSAGTAWTAVVAVTPNLQPAGLSPDGKAFVLALLAQGEKQDPTALGVPESLRRPLPAAPAVVDLDLYLEPRDDLGELFSLRGTVRDPDGRPVVGAKLVFSGLPHVVTDGDGMFDVALAPRTELAQFWVFHDDFVTRSVVPGRSPGGELAVELQPRPRVRGRVTDASGEPAGGAFVQRVAADAHPIHRDWERVDAPRFPVARDGTFDLPYGDPNVVGNTPGPFRIRASVPGGGSGLSRVVRPVDEPTGADVEIRLDPGAEITGRVLDAADEAVAGAEIVLLPLAENDDPDRARFPGALGPPVAGVSAPDGRFRVAHVTPGRYRVTARRAGALSDHSVVKVPGPTVTLRLAEALVISGTARLADGTPAAGVPIDVIGATDDEGSWTTRTAADGSFSMNGLRAGTYDLAFLPDGTGSNVLVHHEQDVPAGTTDLNVELQAGLGIAGTILDAEGRPVHGAVISLQPTGSRDDDEIQVDVRRGRFEAFGLAPGDYDLNMVRIEGTSGSVRLPEPWRVRAGVQDARFELPPQHRVRGRLVDPVGEPLPGVRVRLVGQGGVTDLVVRTDEKGAFSVVSFAGARFRFLLPNHARFVIAGNPEAICGGPEVELRTVEGAVLRGTVRDPDGAPVPGARISLSWPISGIFLATNSADDGTFEVGGLRRDQDYFASVSAHGFTAWGRRVAADNGSLDVTLDRGVTTAGTVVDADGLAVADARVVFVPRDGGGSIHTARTDEEGRFQLEHMKPGLYDARVERSGRPTVRKLGPYEAGSGDLRLALPRR